MTVTTHRLTLLLLYTIISTSCRNPIFEPQFKVSKDSIYATIYKIVETESIFIEGHKIPVDDTLDISLSVQLINAQKLPVDNDSLIDVQKKVASKVKSLLKNRFQYKAYDIIFLQRDTVKGISGTMTSEKGLYPKRFYNVDL